MDLSYLPTSPREAFFMAEGAAATLALGFPDCTACHGRGITIRRPDHTDGFCVGACRACADRSERGRESL